MSSKLMTFVQFILAINFSVIILYRSLVDSQSTIKQQNSPCPFAIKINTNYLYRGSLHFICLQSTGSYPTLDVIQFSPQQLIARIQVDDLGTNQMASFVDDEGILRILLAVPSRRNGTSVYSFDKRGQIMGETHTINTQFVSSMSIWRLELDSQWKLAIANQPTYEQHILDRVTSLKVTPPDPKPMITIHSWRYTYFDLDQLIPLPYDGLVNKIEPMNINGQEFLIIAMEYHHFQASPVPSLIYKLDFGDGTLVWKQFQILNTRFAFDVRSFTIVHQNSLQREYYFALLGSTTTLAPTNTINSTNSSVDDYGLKIFKYFGNHFVSVYSISLPEATALDTLSYGVGDSYVIIALLSGHTKQISLHLFDGLSLKLMNSPLVTENPVGLKMNRTIRTRTLEPSSLHLFLAPTGNTNTTKRTLDVNNEQSISLPALVLSQTQKAPQTYLNADNELAKNELTGSLYSIPVDELLNDDQVTSDNHDTSSSGYSKRNLILDAGASLLNWCHTTVDRLVRDNFEHFSNQLLTLPKIDQNIPIELSSDLVIENDLFITNLLYTSNIIDSDGIVMSNVGQLNSSYTFSGIHDAHLEIDAIKHVVDQILVDDGSIQDVYNTIRFDNLIIDCLNSAKYDPRFSLVIQAPSLSCPYVNEIRTSILNSRNITDLEKQALLTGRSMTITSDVRFEHLILRGNVEIIDTLNGLSIDDIVFKRGPSKTTITGHKNFLTPLFTSSHLSVRFWDGIGELSRQTFLTSSGYQRIDSHNLIGRVVIDSFDSLNNDSFITTINGINLGIHLNQISLSNGVNQLSTPVYCDELILNGKVEFMNPNLVAGIDIQELWSKTMFKMSNQDVLGPIYFNDLVRVSHGGDVEVYGPINGILMNTHSVLMRNRNYNLSNPIIFEQDVNVRALYLERALNGIPITMNEYTRKLELPIMYNNVQQVFDGYKIFNNISLAAYSSIKGKINNNLNLTSLQTLINNKAPHRFSTIYIDGTTIRVAQQAHIQIESINGIDPNKICDLASQVANSLKIGFYNRLKTEQPIHFKKLHCASINGFGDLSNTFLTRYGNQRILGTLKLNNGAIFNTTLKIHSTLNSINSSPLAGAIAKTVNESRYRNKDMNEDLIVEDLIVDRMNNLVLSSIFLSKSDLPQFIRAPMTFDYLDIENVLRVDKNFVTSLFNDINISDILNNTLQYDQPQIIYNHVQLNTLHLLADSNFLTNTLNGINTQRLFNDAVFIDVPQQILAPKTFANQVDLNNRLILRYDIDGLTDDELKFNLLLQTDELIEGDLEFHREVIVKKELEILTGLINDIDINLFKNSLIHENHHDKRGLRITGNGTLTFKDVRLNNLVIGGTIQGIDLSKEALLRKDNLNGTYNSKLREQQNFLNNQRLLEAFYGSDTQFRVRGQYRGRNHTGSCFIHSCSRTSIQPTKILPDVKTTFTHLPVLWKPNNYVQNVPNMNYLAVNQPRIHVNSIPLGIPDHLISAKSQAIRDLSSRVNKYLSVSFYYEIVQKHPLWGPLLHAASNPNLDDRGGSFLFLKATGKPGEPCLKKGQSIAIMSQQRQKYTNSVFTQSSRIQESSDPRTVKSLVVDKNHYLFILDDPLEEVYRYSSMIAIYSWDYQLGMYNIRQRVLVEGFPTSMKAFAINNLACFAIINPKVQVQNFSGAATVFCQTSTLSDFVQTLILPIQWIFDLDFFIIPGSKTILFATLSQQETEQVGDLNVVSYDPGTRMIKFIMSRRVLRPLRLLFLETTSPIETHLVVTEGVTSNDDASAITRIFSLRTEIDLIQRSLKVVYNQIQIIKDSPFYDIQSVRLDDGNSMLFLQSANSISIFAPVRQALGAVRSCDIYYTTIQRLLTKGADRFLVFNDNQKVGNLTVSGYHGHFLVLSKNDCEHQSYATLILSSSSYK